MFSLPWDRSLGGDVALLGGNQSGAGKHKDLLVALREVCRGIPLGGEAGSHDPLVGEVDCKQEG